MLKPGTPVTKINVGANGAVTASQTSGKINTGGYGTVKAFLNVSAISGASASLTVKFQESVDNSTWSDVPSGAFSAQTATGVNTLVLTNTAPYIRAVQTVAGTSPSVTYDLTVAGVGN